MLAVDIVSRTVKSWESESPVVVHCASGAGRTGVLLAIDIGLQSLLEREPVIDVLRIVSALCQDRSALIQTPQQYRFINQVCSFKGFIYLCGVVYIARQNLYLSIFLQALADMVKDLGIPP